MVVVEGFVAYSQDALAKEAERPVVVGTVDTGLVEAAVLDLDHSVYSKRFDLN